MKALSHTYACTHSPLNSPLKKQYHVGSALFSVSTRWQWAMVTQTCIQLGLFLPEELWFSWFPRSLIFSSVTYIKHIFSKRKLPQGEMSFPLIHTVYFTFSSVAQSCSTPCNPMDCSTPGFPVHHQLQGLTQTHVHRVSDAIKPSHLLSSPSPSAFHLSQHQGLF